MKFVRALMIPLLLPAVALAQAGQDAVSRATRMSQLMESTAVAVPDLIGASEPVRHMAETTLTAMRDNPRDAAFPFRFINQVRAYLALSDSFPASQLPAAAERQFGELREDLVRFQQTFEAALEARYQGETAAEADPNNLHRYAEANSKLPPLGTLARVVFLGDSITEGWHLNESFPGREFLNRGIDGQTTTQMLGRFLQDVVSLRPKVVVVLAGTNDIAYGISPPAIENNLTMMGELAKAHGVRSVFASIPPVSEEASKAHPLAAIRLVNQWLQEYCAREGFVYLDFFKALADSQGHLPADLSGDGLHPNSRGYSVMSPVALEAINKALAPAAPATPAAPPRHRFSLPIVKP
jgi:lysophospholipase L1-like esterase